jgi:hypothetical protein
VGIGRDKAVILFLTSQKPVSCSGVKGLKLWAIKQTNFLRREEDFYDVEIVLSKTNLGTT